MMSRSISPSPEIEPHHEQPTKTTSNLTSSSSGKRKRDGVESHDLSTRTVAKKKRSEKSKAGEDENLDLVQGLNMTIGKLDSRLLADYVAQRQRRFGQYLSSVEMEDRYIPECAFVDTSDWDKLRVLPNMPDFLNSFCNKPGQKKNMSSASKTLGAPHTIVITSAGLRAAEITRALRTFQTKEVIVAKLFAKHIKLADAIDYVKKTRMGIGVGTPSRIIALLTAGALSSENLERLVVDCSYIDQKKRGIFDMRETQQPLMKLLNRDDVKSRYGANKDGITLLLY